MEVTEDQFAAQLNAVWEEFSTRVEQLKVFKARFRRDDDDSDVVNTDYDSKLEAMKNDFKAKLDELRKVKVLKVIKPDLLRRNEAGDFDLENNKLANVGDPQDETHAVNLRTLKQHIAAIKPDLLQRNEAGNINLTNVADPQEDTDAVNFRTLARYHLQKDFVEQLTRSMRGPVGSLLPGL